MLLRGPAEVLVRPLARGWWTYMKGNWQQIPQPTDEPRASADGPDPYHVTLIGNGPARGFGVASHNLALPGHLARLLARATGRGTQVHAITDGDIGVHDIEIRFAMEAAASELVIVMLGLSDAVRLTSARIWQRGLHGLFQRIERTMPSGVGVLMVDIPPVFTAPMIRGPIRMLANDHARMLNEATAAVASCYPNVTRMPFKPPAEPDSHRHRSSGTYRRWAELIAAPAVDILLEHRVGPPA